MLFPGDDTDGRGVRSALSLRAIGVRGLTNVSPFPSYGDGAGPPVLDERGLPNE